MPQPKKDTFPNIQHLSNTIIQELYSESLEITESYGPKYAPKELLDAFNDTPMPKAQDPENLLKNLNQTKALLDKKDEQVNSLIQELERANQKNQEQLKQI